MENSLWAIGSPDGKSADLLDNYKQPNGLGAVVWRIDPSDAAGQATMETERASQTGAKWPIYHPSEADPEAGYQLHPYTILFNLDQSPTGRYVFRFQYIVIAPRLAYVEIVVNGHAGQAYLRPVPSESGEIRLLSGLHTTIYSEGVCEVVIPADLLRPGENRIELTSRDGGEVLVVDNIEAIRRLDRMANGAGFIYQYITLHQEDDSHAVLPKVEIQPTVLYKTQPDGSLAEVCNLFMELPSILPASEWVLELVSDEHAETLPIELPAATFGHLQTAFLLRDGSGPVRYALRGVWNGQALTFTGQVSRRRKWKVFATPHAHTDIGYTHRQWEVGERLCRNIDTAIQWLERETAAGNAIDPAFRYHLDASWALDIYLATRSEAQKQLLLKHVKAGNIGIPTNYVDVMTHTCGLEDLIRNGVFSEDYLRPHGKRAEFAAVVDVASLTSAFPDILEGSGVRYLIHANNQDRGPFRLNGGIHRRSPFYWHGIAGGQVLVWLSKMYCELRKVCGSPPVISSAERGLNLWLAEYDRLSYAPDAVLLYGQEADNTDLDPQPISFTKQWNETYAYPQLISSDVVSFFKYVEANFGDQLEHLSGDGGAYWEDGVGSGIQPTIAVRQAQAMMLAAERIESLAAVHNEAFAYPTEHFDAAWKQILLFDEHTWGAFLSCTEPDAMLQQDQWAVKEQMARDAFEWAKRLLHTAASRHSLMWNNDGREVVVYNVHSWAMSGYGVVEIGVGEGLFDAQTGTQLQVRTLWRGSTQRIVSMFIDNIAGLSYRRFVLRDGQASPDGQDIVEVRRTDGLASTPSGTMPQTIVLDNDYYRLVVDVEHGCVNSWFDKDMALELVDTSDPWGLGQLLYVPGGEGTRLISNQADLPDGNPQPIGRFNLVDYTLRHSGIDTSLVVIGDVPEGRLEVEWKLPARVKQVGVSYTYHKRAVTSKEAVYVAFPLSLKGAAVSSDVHLGWVNWDTDQLPGGCKEWLPLQTGIHLATDAANVLVCSPDIPLFCVGDVVRGRWPKELNLTGGRIFSYVLNNYWHTNFKASQGGPISFTYILTSDHHIPFNKAYQLGWSARQPLYAHRMSYQAFRDVKSPYTAVNGGHLAQIGSDSVVVSTIHQAKWSEGLIIRLQETTGNDAVAPVSFPERRIQSAWLTDLLERDIRPLQVERDGRVEVEVPAWGLANVRVVLE